LRVVVNSRMFSLKSISEDWFSSEDRSVAFHDTHSLHYLVPHIVLPSQEPSASSPSVICLLTVCFDTFYLFVVCLISFYWFATVLWPNQRRLETSGTYKGSRLIVWPATCFHRSANSLPLRRCHGSKEQVTCFTCFETQLTTPSRPGSIRNRSLITSAVCSSRLPGQSASRRYHERELGRISRLLFRPIRSKHNQRFASEEGC
jgi:hypothetical protein